MAKQLEAKAMKTLRALVAAPTPTGSEHAGMMILAKRIKDETGLKPYIDVHGNLHCVLDRGAKRTVMIEGHCDEIGFIGQYIDDDGFVYVQALGGVTGGLAVAFETTLIALVLALLVQLYAKFVQAQEEQFLDECADYCNRNIIARMKDINLAEEA